MSSESEREPKLSCIIDNLIKRIGFAAAWFNVVLAVVIIIQVVLRYKFGLGLVALEELQWHLFAAAFMIGLSYCLVTDSHIRLDVLRVKFSRRTQEWIEILGTVFLLMPMIIVIFMHSLDFFWDAWRVGESSDAPLGLCCRWVIKSILPISFMLLFLAAVSRLIRAISFIVNTERN